MACLGLAQADASGNVNVSRFGPRLAGAGGFINISQNARSVVFAGTFVAKGLEIEISDGALNIRKDGTTSKFLKQVEQITFSGMRAARQEQPVLYVTERCVFRLTKSGLELAEIAPGIDPESHILSLMNFTPKIAELTEMDARIFRDEQMGIAKDLLHLDLPERIALDAETGRLFVNLEKMRVRSRQDIEVIQLRVEQVCGPLGKKVDAIANYDGFQIDDDVAPDYAAMVNALEERFYSSITRYSGSAFIRLKLGEMFRGSEAHIFKTREAAEDFAASSNK